MFTFSTVFVAVAVAVCNSYTLNFPSHFHDCGTNVNVWSMDLTPMPPCTTQSNGASFCEIVLNQTYVGHINFTSDREFHGAYNYASTEFAGTRQEIFIHRDACRTPANPTGTECPIRPGVNQMYVGSITVEKAYTSRQVGKWEVLSREADHSKGSTIMCFVFPVVIVDPNAKK